MTSEELQVIVASRGHETRIKKNELQVRECWFCNNPKWNLELSASKGVYRCWACKASGRLQDLLSDDFGVEIRIPVRYDKKERNQNFKDDLQLKTMPVSEVYSAQRYLLSRGLTELDLKIYEMKVCVEEGNSYYGRILIPAREFWTQHPVGFVARAYMGERPKYLSAVDPVCVVGYKHVNFTTPYVLVEGLLDATNVHRAGFNAAALLGKGTYNEFDAWIAHVPPESPVVLLLDGDAQDTALQLWWRAKAIRERVVIAPLPVGMDPGTLLPSVIKALISKAVEQVPA